MLTFTIFNLVLAFFPLTALLAANTYLLARPLTREMIFLALLFFAVFAVNQLVYLRYRKERGHVLFYLLVVLAFLWNPLLDLIGTRAISGIGLYFAIVLVVFVLMARATRSPEFTRIAAFTLFVYALLPMASAALRPASQPGEGIDLTEAGGSGAARALPAPQVRPNLYFLLFDCMASTGVFLEQVNTSEKAVERVDRFERRMEALGFTHLTDAWSNYERTNPSLLSFFNFEYHEGSADSSKWYQKYFGFTTSAMLEYLHDAGYRVVSRKKDVPCPEALDTCYESASPLELVSILAASTPLLDMLRKLEKYVFTPLGSGFLRDLTARLATMKLVEVDHFIDYLDGTPVADRPEFVYAHFEAAHPVNYYDEDCDTKSIALFEQRSGEDRIAEFSFGRYGAEYLCFLDRIVEVVEAVQRRDPGAWILVFSDHGFGAQKYGVDPWTSWEKEKLDATFRILNLVKTSPACDRELAKLKGNVNKARGLVNCLSGETALPYLPELVDLRYLQVDRRLIILPDGYE